MRPTAFCFSDLPDGEVTRRRIFARCSPELRSIFALEPRLEHWAEVLVAYQAMRDERLIIEGTDNSKPGREEADLAAWLWSDPLDT